MLEAHPPGLISPIVYKEPHSDAQRNGHLGSAASLPGGPMAGSNDHPMPPNSSRSHFWINQPQLTL